MRWSECGVFVVGLLLRALAWYLRTSPLQRGKPRLLRFCREVLLPKMPAFSAVSRVPATGVRLNCFQLGGRYHSDILSEWLFFSGKWQPNLSRWLQRFLKPGDTFVDVGANTGYFSLLGASLVGTEGGVVAVEASPQTVGRLQANLGLNPHLAGCVRVVPCIAAEGGGSATLYCHKREQLYNTTVMGAGAGGVAAAPDVWSLLQASGVPLPQQTRAATAALASDSVWQPVQVRKASLQGLLSAYEAGNARVIKIDVEGGEWSVLQGLTDVLENGRIDLEVVVELTPEWLAMQGVSTAQLLDFMRGYGFNAYVLAADEYDLAQCVPPRPPVRPTRVRTIGEKQVDVGVKQADVIFSRRDVEAL